MPTCCNAFVVRVLISHFVSFLLQVADSDRGDSGDGDHSDVAHSDVAHSDVAHSDIGGSASDITRSGDDDASIFGLREALKASQAEIRALTERLQRVESENAALQAQVSCHGSLQDIRFLVWFTGDI